MGFLDEYNKALEEEKKKKKKTTSSNTTKKTSSFMDTYRSSLAGMERVADDDIAPIVTRASKKKEDDRSWFKKGLFEDGYDFGDVTRTILGTTTDVLENLGTGIIGMGEKAVDALAYIAPFAENAQFYQNGGGYNLELQKQHDKMVEQSKKDLGKFIAKDLYDEEAVSRAIISDPARMIGIDSESHSVFGEKTDSIIQSGGQLLATAGLASAGLPWWVTTGATSFGSEAENAMNQGATYEEAGASAAISAGAEILSEKLSGGISFGGKTLDDSLTKMLARGISNKVGRTLAKLGLDMAGEGAEEVFSQVASNLGSSLYKEEDLTELLTNEEAMDGYLEAFIGGAALGGVAGGFNAVKSNRNGVDYVSELTDNEQKVVEKVYNDRVAEAEENGKVSQKEKSKIYDQVLKDMERGYISTDTIEEALAGDLYKKYKQDSEWEESIQKEYDELYNMKNGDKSSKQVDREAQLKQYLESFKDSGSKTLKEQIGTNVFERVKGDRLAESYNERTRRGQKYEADLSRYDENQQKVIQKAVDSGVLNNTNRTHEFVDIVAKISADKGVLFDFTNNAKLKESGFAVDGKQVNGYVTKDGITLNIDSPKAWQSTVGHEITHVLEGTELYNELQKAIFTYATSKKEYVSRLNTLKELYKDVEGADAYAELTADLVGEYLFTDENFINNLSTGNRNVFQKIYDEIKYLYKVVTAGSKEARELEKVKRAFDKAYRESGKSTADVKSEDFYDSETKYSLRVADKETLEFLDNQETVTTYKTMQLVDGKLYPPMASRIEGKFEDYSELGSWEQATEHPELIKNGNKFKLDKGKGQGSIEAAYNPYMHSSNLVLNDQFSGAYKRDNLVTVECEVPVSELTSGYHAEFAKDSVGWHPWHTGTVAGQLRNAKGTERQVLLSRWIKPVRIVPDSEVASMYKDLLDGTNVEVPDNVVTPSLLNELKKAGVKIKESGRVKYSLSDSDGKQLTKEQAEYFKDSKMRDENGNLKVMYHGSQDAGFHVFDSKMSDDDTSFFFVDRNDVAASYSGTSETYEAKTIRTAEDMNNFLAEIGYDQYEAVEKNGKFELLENNEHVAWSDTAQGIYEEFCWYEGVGEGDANYKVYLNLKNPLKVDAQGRNWDKINSEFSQVIYDRYQTLTEEEKAALTDLAEWEDFGLFKSEIYGSPSAKDEVSQRLKSAYYKLMDENQDIDMYQLFDIASDNFTEESLRENAVQWLKTRDYAQRAKEQGYDGVIFKNIVDNGGYSNGSEGASTVAIAFDSNQIKSVANAKPTSDPDIRFSLSKPVEETKDLMALHNLTEQKLLKSLKLGGLPMPSVAIAKAKDGHSEFGEISLVLPKETIDPQSSSRNKLYSGDAWTPTYPKVDYKLNSKVLKQIREKVNGLVPGEVLEFGRLHLDSDNMEDIINRYNGDVVDAFKDNDALKYAYLMEAGADIELPMKEKNLSYHGSRENGAIIKVAESIPAEDIQKALNGGSEEIQKLEPAVRKAVAEYVRETYGDDKFILDTFAPEEGLSFSDLDGYLVEARKYLRNGVEKTVDSRPARELIRDMTVQYSYEEWLRNLFSGIVEKEGIRNNKDYFTPSGNRRSFEALHYEHNLENVVKAMREKGEKGIGFGGGSIFGAATTVFSSVDEMKQSSDRLQHMTEEEYQEIKDGFTKRFFDLASSLPNDKKSFIATDDAANTLTEAVAKYQTRSGIANYLRRELKGWATYSPQVVDDLIELVNDIRSMPTGYFEAKPQRAVGFEEVGVFVIPKDADIKLKQELLNKGYSIAEYDPNVEGDRTRVLNQYEEYKFSLSNVGEESKRYGNYATPARDLLLDVAPVKNTVDDVDTSAPTAKESTVVAENATTAPTVSEMETIEFPDDGNAEQEELETLISEEAEIRGVMEAYAGVGDIEAVNKLIPEHESIKARIRELQQRETDRADSLTDADAPPEMEAPLSIKSENFNPYKGITLDDISRSHRTYSDRNPGARKFIGDGALGFLYDVNNSTHGERWYNDELYYATGGEQGFGGTSRATTDDIADLKDTYGYTWEQLRKAAEDVVKGEVRSVAAKRVEYLVHNRLLEGYTDVDGRRYDPNQEYITFLNESFANEQRAGSFDNLLQNASKYAPPDIAPVLKKATPDTQTAPIFESKEPGIIKGQTTLFEPKKPSAPKKGKTANIWVDEPKTPKRRNRFWSLVKEHVLDNGMVFEDLSKEIGNREIEAKWNFIRYARSKAQSLIGNGTESVKSLKDIKKEVEQAGKTEQLYAYLYHKHNVDRMTLEDRFDNTPNKAVFGDSVTADVSQRIVDKYERTEPSLQKYAEDVYKYMNHLRGLLVENGVISKETADLWEKMYPHYVPIRRVGQDDININVPLDSRKTTVNNPVKKATGGNQDILPLFDTMAQRTIQTYRAIAKNSFGIELKNQLGTVVDKNAPTVDDVIDSLDTDDALLKPGEKGKNPTFTVFENGERVEFEITEDMYEALKPKSEAMQYRNKILNTASSVFRGLTTQYSIPFMATNAIKDAQDVLINSQHPAKTYANFPRAWYQQATDGKWYREYIENGGEDNTYFDNETNEFKEDSGLMKAVKFPLNAISTANNFIELTPRLAEYIASREAGRSIEVAMLDAARVTTNFNAGGDVTKFLNANGATFLNASVQGAIQQVRNIREAHHKGVMGYLGLAARFAVAGVLPVVLNNMLWDDDEDYEELADYVKQDYYVVGKYGDGKFIRIPKGRTVAVMQNAVEQVQNALTGDDEVDLKNFLTMVVNNLAPNNPIENNILAPVMQVANNKTWYGEDLVPSRLQDLPAAEQYDEKTDSFSKKLGEKFGISPYKINYLLNQYSGGLGDLILPMMTPRAESGNDSLLGNLTAPLRDKFTTDSVINSQVVTDFYDTKDALAVQANSSKSTEDDYFRDLYMDTVGYELSDLYKQKREIQNSDLSDSEKYAQTRELQEQIVRRMKESLDSYNNINADGNYAEIGDLRFNRDEESGKWYQIREKNSDGSDNWYYQMEQEVTDALGISYAEYWNNREEYNYAYEKPEQYALSKAVGGYQAYRSYTSELYDIKADKDENGKSISGSRKEKVIDYINGLDADYGEKIILFKSQYNSDDTYNYEIIDYLNSRDDISYDEMATILRKLGFNVDAYGNITW